MPRAVGPGYLPISCRCARRDTVRTEACSSDPEIADGITESASRRRGCWRIELMAADLVSDELLQRRQCWPVRERRQVLFRVNASLV